MDYHIRFERRGTSLGKAGVLENEVWLDVGNALQMGCFDHHQAQAYRSTCCALIDNLHYLSDLKRSIDTGEKTVLVHMHEAPDLDCISSYFVVRYYLEHNEDEVTAFFSKNGAGRILAEYIDDIDQGIGKITDYPTLYAVFSVLDVNMDRTEETDFMVIEQGLSLIEMAIEMLEEQETDLRTCDDLKTYDFSGRLQDTFGNEIAIIQEHQREILSEIPDFEPISLWTKEGAVEKVPAAIWETPPRNPSAYNTARKNGAFVTIVPYSVKGMDGAATTRVFASIDPQKDPEKKYTLRPIAEIIEQKEQMEEQRLFEKDGVYRRDHSRPRNTHKHLGEMPFAATSDPWYSSPEEDLFDAPGAESILEYDDILEIIRSNGSMVKKSYAITIGANRNSHYEMEKVSLSQWQEEMRSFLQDKSSYHVVWGELDSSLIKNNNRILEAFCMNLIGRSFHEGKSRNIIYPDYRTCIYTDLNGTIILEAKWEGMDTAAYRSLVGILETGDRTQFENSPLVQNIENLVKQRNTLLEFGNRISELQPGKRKDIEALNRRLLTFSIQIQKDDMIEDTVEREIYSFMKKEFGILELKSSIMDEMGIIVNESRDRLVSKFNILSAFAVPFILVATVFQMGIVRFDEIFKLFGISAWIGWVIVIILIIVLILVVGFFEKRKE